MTLTTQITKTINTESIISNASINDNERISDEDELYKGILIESYKNLYLKWTGESQVLKKKKERIETLLQEKKTRLMLTILELKK